MSVVNFAGQPSFSVDGIEWLSQIYEDEVEVHVLLKALLLNLSYCEDHIHCALIGVEVTL